MTLTITSSVQADEAAAPEFPPCCGLEPRKLTWAKGMGKDAVVVLCQNPHCPNHEGVFACEVDITNKWQKFRNKIMTAAQIVERVNQLAKEAKQPTLLSITQTEEKGKEAVHISCVVSITGGSTSKLKDDFPQYLDAETAGIIKEDLACRTLAGALYELLNK